MGAWGLHLACADGAIVANPTDATAPTAAIIATIVNSVVVFIIVA